MIHGLHLAFISLGALTILSALIFNTLKRGDGAGVAQARELIPASRLGD